MGEIVSFNRKTSVVKEVLSKKFAEREVKEFPCFECKKRKCKKCDFNHSFHLRNAGRCARYIALFWLLGEPDFDGITLRRMFKGTIFHLGFTEFLNQKGVLVEAETPIYKEFPDGQILKGKIDAIVATDEGEVPIELKTTSSAVKNLPYASDISQLECYLEFTHYPFGELIYVPETKIQESSFLSEEANSAYYLNFEDWCFFIVQKPPKNKYLKKFRNIFKLILQGKLPERIVTKECKWCRLSKICFQNKI